MSEKSNRARTIVAERLATERARQRRRRTLLVSVIALVILLVTAGVGVGVYLTNRPENVALPTGANRAGVTVGRASAPVTVDVYLDFQCPYCKQFEAQSSGTLQKFVTAGTVKVVYHPVAYLDRMSSGTRYSSRSAAATGCAADTGKLPAFVAALYANQPTEGGSGLTDATMVALAAKAGITGSTFSTCVRDEAYRDWTTAVTDTASKSGVVETPTVKVDGAALASPTVAALTDAVNAATARR